MKDEDKKESDYIDEIYEILVKLYKSADRQNDQDYLFCY